jgi:hypothetical protein
LYSFFNSFMNGKFDRVAIKFSPTHKKGFPKVQENLLKYKGYGLIPACSGIKTFIDG